MGIPAADALATSWTPDTDDDGSTSGTGCGHDPLHTRYSRYCLPALSRKWRRSAHTSFGKISITHSR
jgi:hypothetical protein